MKKRKVRSAAAQKALIEKERAQRLNRLAAELEERNDLADAGVKIFQYPLPHGNGDTSQISGVRVKHGSMPLFDKIKNK